MPTEAKARTIEEAKECYSRAKGIVFADYRGLKVKEMQALRAKLRDKDGDIHVIKNTLFRIAAGADADTLPYEFHNGPTAVAFLYGSESEGAKALFDYAQTNKKFEIKGGFFSGKAFDVKQVEAISKLPPRDVLIAQVIGAIAAPLTTLVGTIEALYADPIRVIGAVADKVAEGSPIPVAAVAAVEEPAAEEAPTPTPEVEPESTPSEPVAEPESAPAETQEN